MKWFHTLGNLLFLAGTIVMMIFVILGGSSSHTPIRQFWWLEADTQGIGNSRWDRTAWSFWGKCNANDFNDCDLGPAYPISPQDNFRTTDVPGNFHSSRGAYFYLTKFAFAFCLIAFCFVCFTFLTHLAQFCFTRGDKYNTFLLAFALFFAAGWVSFQTAVVVMARDAFKGHNAKVAVKTMALMWTSFFLILVLFFSSVWATVSASWKSHMDTVRGGDNSYYQPHQSSAVHNDQSSFTRANAPEIKDDNSGGIRFFKIKRNAKAEADDESV
ncbi:hypothetical protein DIURU_004475 [Diutina rugosa]|uniref:Protein SUR7 n=1 Tax=Diutina rugosa TaxID=5481 RepID=A0A642UHH7_DIURU|nr:uncharacterized protein DIURU_004475 [Diutina rugosa]KAA8899094.1 hypothetical protein DIURU_004475 [Diutina rugosa]